ncbi:MAG TPA: copper resistance CopC family protein [Thermodesulfobacteriota bacterium]|nr:copper resistance CopC family protein [Thermodesulfobacteriota bacterium]
MRARIIQKIKTITLLCLLTQFVLWPEGTIAHVFPERAEPPAGAVVDVAPYCIQIWFDRALNPIFSSIKVQNEEGRRVDNGDSKVDNSNPNLIVVSIPPLPSGTYHVFWSVVSRDGHRTEGDYIFTIR